MTAMFYTTKTTDYEVTSTVQYQSKIFIADKSLQDNSQHLPSAMKLIKDA